jgi:hypothetical protein
LFRRDGRDQPPVMERLGYVPCVEPLRLAYSALYFSASPASPFRYSASGVCVVRESRVSSLFRSTTTRSPTGLLPEPTADPDAPTFPVCSRDRQHARARSDSVSRKREEERRRRWRLDCRGFPIPRVDPREEGRGESPGKERTGNWRELPRLICCISRLIGEGGGAYSEE